MSKNLLIVFAKNKLFGQVKTRLAQSIGDESAYSVYESLYHLTEKESTAVKNADVHVYYSHEIDNLSWKGCKHFVQKGNDLGERMLHAFEAGFAQGYEQIIGIGADLPEISSELIERAFKAFNESDFVFGPAEDGGYYLVGMSNRLGLYVFENKPWSTSALMDLTKIEMEAQGNSYSLLEVLNDIDNLEDLEKSSIGHLFGELIEKKNQS